MRTTTGFTAAVAALALLVAPLVTVSAAQAVPGPTLTGITGGYAETWIDKTISAEFTVGVPYSDSVQAPTCCTGYGGMLTDLPSWMTAEIDTDGTVTLSGTPTTAGQDLYVEVEFGGSDGTYFSIEFWIDVVADTTPTTTTVDSGGYWHYTGVNLSAQVSTNTSGGTVDFYLDSTKVGTGMVTGVGSASYSGAVPASFVGTSPVLTAVFSGTDDFAGSTSNEDSVYIYGDRVISGTVSHNGVGVSGEPVALLTTSFAPTGMTATTDANGVFSFDVGDPPSYAAAIASYAIEATDLGLYYSVSGGPGLTNVTSIAGASVLPESSWASNPTIFLNTAPVWTDQTLHQPRLGESYSDSVAATSTGTPSTVTYSIRSGTLPSWLSFSNGSFTATEPTDQLAHTFEVQASSAYGLIYRSFTLQAGDAGVAPTFTDTTIADLTVGTELTDDVTATGDPIIVYSSTTLPPGLTLDPSSGELTGTPTTAGDYVVTFTATNDFGSDTYVWEPTVLAAPEIDLVLNFAAGATIDDAETEIGADGLQVGSTYTLYMFSTPRLLYSGIVDSSGGFTWLVTLPADTPVGAHELVLTGVAPDGTVLTARAWFTLLSNGTIGAISYTGAIPFRLALTGSDPLLPLGIAGGLLVAGYLIQRRSRAVRVP